MLALSLSGPALAEEEAAGSAISGSLNFDFNTHFMSYGLNVWQRDDFEDLLFNPSFDLNFDVGEGFSIFIGTWWDVNNNASTTVGQSVQEVDVWLGGSYAVDMFSISLTYQEWMYGGDAERILDVGLGLDTLLSPSLTIHNRIDGNGGQDRGTVFVLGASHGFDVGPVSIGGSLDVGFVTEDYYVNGEGGFGYVAVGPNISIPLSFVPTPFGEWSLNGGITYYYTDDDNIGNTDDSIVTGMFGVSLAF